MVQQRHEAPAFLLVRFTGWYPQYRKVAKMEMTELAGAQQQVAQHTTDAIAGVAPAAPPREEQRQQQAERLEEGLQTSVHWSAYPAMPTPQLAEMRGQSMAGSATVLTITAVLVGATHAAVALGELDGFQPSLFLGAIWGAASVALLCLLGLMFGDPGVIERCEERCTPLPDGAVRERILSGQPITSDIRNIDDPVRGTFCVRCLVWRAPAERAHHCSTCGRCVKAFDHHCGVFGRCIAGDGFRGNMGYFKVIIAMAPLGGVIALAAVAAAAAQNDSWAQLGMYAGIGLAAYCGLALLCGGVASFFGRRRLLAF